MFYHALTGNGGATPTGDLLWTNANPTAEMGVTNIPGDYSKYKSIIVKAKITTITNFINNFNIPKENENYTSGIYFTNTNAKNSPIRSVLFTNEKITISDGLLLNNINNSATTASSVAIPLEIYGVE